MNINKNNLGVEKFNPNLKPAELILTAAAVVHFKKMLNEDLSKTAVRFDVSKTGCSGYSYLSELISELDIHDQDIKIENIKDFSAWMTARAKPLINGLMIDYQKQSLGQSKLIYTNPNETARCGCGVSFSVDKAP